MIENNMTYEKKDYPVLTFSCFTLCDNCLLHCKMCEKWKPDIYIKPERKQLELGDWKKCAISLKKIVPEDHGATLDSKMARTWISKKFG